METGGEGENERITVNKNGTAFVHWKKLLHTTLFIRCFFFLLLFVFFSFTYVCNYVQRVAIRIVNLLIMVVPVHSRDLYEEKKATRIENIRLR